MRIVPVNCVSGEVNLAKHLYNSDGNILLKRGTKLTENLLKRIEENNIYTIYIEDGFSNTTIEDLVRPELREKAIHTLKEAFAQVEKSNIHAKKSSGNDLKKNLMIKSMEKYISSLKVISEEIIDDITNNRQLMINLVDIKNLDTYTYQHSLNVAVISLIIGIEMKMGKSDLGQLFLGALMHDIGKAFISKDLITKKDTYTTEEADIIKSHSQLGYDYVKENFGFPITCKMAILQHHERYDGMGYPRGLSGEIIHRFARIIAIADVYDSMTSDTFQSRALPPNEALEYIMGASGGHFDYDIATIFCRKVVPYPEGTLVDLSNGNVAVVSSVNSNYPLRPIVKIPQKNIPIEQWVTIDLMTHTSITILNIHFIAPFDLPPQEKNFEETDEFSL